MRIGFMGGTFSPPHNGHFQSAKIFIQEMELDRLIIIPAKVSPFKVNQVPTATDNDRMEMSKLCFLPLDSDVCRVEVSDIEMKKDSTSYTVDTINELYRLYPNCELFMYVGGDMFTSLEKWKSSEEIFAKCHIYARCREENELNALISLKDRYTKLYGARITLSASDEIVVSSTQVRNAIGDKNIQTCRNLLTDSVFEYIIKSGLYFDEQ